MQHSISRKIGLGCYILYTLELLYVHNWLAYYVRYVFTTYFFFQNLYTLNLFFFLPLSIMPVLLLLHYYHTTKTRSSFTWYRITFVFFSIYTYSANLIRCYFNFGICTWKVLMSSVWGHKGDEYIFFCL